MFYTLKSRLFCFMIYILVYIKFSIHDIKPLGKDDKHLKISLKDHSSDICTAVAFNFSEKLKPYKAGDTLGLVKFEVQENLFNGRSSAQVVLVEVIDIK